MSGMTVVRTLVPRVSRSFSTSMRTQIENTVKAKQARFQQENDGLPVHLKGGAKDRLVYIAVMGLTGAGTLWACTDLVRLSFK
ncbi:Cytochrome c oxidase subunit 7A2, mitochondrial [Holothuria leucospilota]|uniref:Cytochrome c oxidase subunit 7A2, mitochondrial n=1 Tax=Holothuria leucospilota TaxID=206669 RepID=A0A9Q1CIZ9_HOLLE|nr:Cytochrome c oxidase subunit 7A2, mitochondrial [Holothuria leucospilota]